MNRPYEYAPLRPRKDGARSFAVDYRVRTGDIDQEMRVRLDGIARYLQDIANDNIAAVEFRDSDPYWIIRRTVVDVIEPITWPSDIHLERWAGAVSTRWTNMRVSLTADSQTNRFNPDPRPNGRVETEAFWININEDGMPSRISDVAFEALSQMTDEHRLRWKAMNPGTAPDPADLDVPDREHVLRITDFDPFKHLNNAAYLEAIEDELVEHADLVERPHRLVIEYLRPITPGTPITVRRKRDGDVLLVWMMIPVDGGLQVAASVSIAPIPEDAY